jgi:nucleolar MIF4G domain-containing protein 1
LENKGGAQAAADIELERRLAKKLKVKDGKVKGPKDGFDELLGGLKDFGGQEEVGAGLEKGLGEESGSDSEEGGSEGSDEGGFGASDDDGFGGLLGEDSDSEGSEGLGFDSESEDDDDRSRRKEPTRKKGQTSERGEGRKQGIAGTGENGDLGESSDDMGLEDDLNDDLSGFEGSSEEQGHGSEGSDHESVPTASGRKEVVIETDIFGRPKKGDAGGSAAVKYVPPHLRAAAKGPLNEEIVRLQRRIRGLLNRLTEANVESITSDMVLTFHVRRGSRTWVSYRANGTARKSVESLHHF